MLKENTKLIYIEPQVTDRKELFNLIAEDLHKGGFIADKKAFFRSVMSRELMGSTAVLPNVAIPHAHCSSVRKVFLVIVVSKKGIDYNSGKKKIVNIIFLMGCTCEQNKEYLQLLATTARILRNEEFRKKLIESNTKDEVYQLLGEYCPSNLQDREDKNSMLVITLLQPDRLNDLISALIEVGINNASIITASSMGKRLSYEIPVFAGLKFQGKSQSIESNVIIATISDNNIPLRLAFILREQGFDIDIPNNGFMQVFKLKSIIGHPDEFI